MSKTEETKLKDRVQEYLKSQRVWQIRYQAQSNLNGLPDIMFLYKGVLVGIELKADKGKPTKLQLKKLEAINENGGVGLIVRDLADVVGIILGIEMGTPNKRIVEVINESE